MQGHLPEEANMKDANGTSDQQEHFSEEANTTDTYWVDATSMIPGLTIAASGVKLVLQKKAARFSEAIFDEAVRRLVEDEVGSAMIEEHYEPKMATEGGSRYAVASMGFANSSGAFNLGFWRFFLSLLAWDRRSFHGDALEFCFFCNHISCKYRKH